VTPPGFRPDSVTIDPDCQAQYDVLERAAGDGRKPRQGIWTRFQAAVARIKSDPQWGEVIPGADIPSYFRDRYDAENLYCIDLKGDVRCFYMIDQHDVIFLDLVDHVEYDKWFPPKGERRGGRGLTVGGKPPEAAPRVGLSDLLDAGPLLTSLASRPCQTTETS
jgi:hypothetical protein